VGEVARSSYSHARHPLAVWIPDLSLALAIVTLVYCLGMFDGWHALFRDSDTGWHIRTGEAILDSRALPTTDPFSFSRPAAPWLDWEWGSDVLSAAAHRAAGLPGVAALFSLAIAACTWLWTRLHFASGGTLLLACAMAAPMLSTVNLHWLARPHVFGWVLLLTCLLMLEQRARTAWFVLLGVIWANLHGSFFLGPLVALLYGLGHFVRPYIWPAGHAPNSRWKAALAMAAGTLVNPYGWQLHVHVAQYLSDRELLSRIGEFQTFNFHADGAGQILLTLVIAATGAIAALSQRRTEHFLISLFFAALAIRSARALPLVALAVLPLANGAITEALRRARGLAPRFRRRLESVFDYSDRLRVLDRSVSGLALVPVIILLTAAATRTASAGFPMDQFPVEASAAVAALPHDARILAPDKFGGYLIYQYSGKRKVFFDGRSDFYGAAFMKDYIRLVEVRPGWHDQLGRFAFTHALLPVNYSLVPALEQRGWRRMHQDATAILLVAPAQAMKDQ
jgi:hypothetical protein